MSPAAWERVKEIVADSLELAPSDRAVFLARACAGHPDLRSEVEALLAADTDTGFLSLDRPREPDEMPVTIGAYRVDRDLGRGGMGVVYLAHRDDGQFQQKAAIKLIKRGMDTDLILLRFFKERQILARLRHPNITSLLDGGMTNDGLPYFVMEWIDGEPIDRFAHRLSTNARICLFLQVCSAVEYAHANLILHRDIKAGNVLVGPDGVPKLLDFGIAKLLEEDSSAERTATLMRAFTPQAASPEQERGEPLTTATDIYSLGVLLRAILPERKHPDLATIIGKATQPESSRRYASVSVFAADLRHFLAGEPVTARPDSFAYRAGKFISRNRRSLSIAALVLAALGSAGTYGLVEARRAQRRFQEVREIAHSVIFEMNDALNGVPGATAARALLVERATRYLDALMADAGSDPALSRELADAYEKLGALQGDRTTSHTGDIQGALNNLSKSHDLNQRLKDTDAMRRVAGKLSLVEITLGHFQPALKWARQSSSDWTLSYALLQSGDLKGSLAPTERYLKQLDARPDKPANQHDIAVCLQRLTQIQARLRMTPQALASIDRARRIDEKLLAADPNNVVIKGSLALDYQILARSSALRRDSPDTEMYLRKTLALQDEILAADPNNERPFNSSRITCSLLAAWLAKHGRAAESLSMAQRTMAMARQMQSRHPTARTEADLADAYIVLGDAWAASHNLKAARQNYEEAHEILIAMQSRGALSIDDATELKGLEAKLAR